MHEELDEAAGNASLNDGLNLVVGAVREVGNCPACIDKHFVIEAVYKLGEDREGRSNLNK